MGVGVFDHGAGKLVGAGAGRTTTGHLQFAERTKNGQSCRCAAYLPAAYSAAV